MKNNVNVIIFSQTTSLLPICAEMSQIRLAAAIFVQIPAMCFGMGDFYGKY